MPSMLVVQQSVLKTDIRRNPGGQNFCSAPEVDIMDDIRVGCILQSYGQGKWIEVEDKWECSLCHYKNLTKERFCPYCKSEMDGR